MPCRDDRGDDREWCEIGADEISDAARSPAVQPASLIQSLTPQHLPQLQPLAERVYARWVQGLAH